MSRRDSFILLALALIFNLGLAAFVHEPRYIDDAYYYGGALRLVEGQGFTSPYFWNYVGSPTALPAASHSYWMPLTSIVAAASMTIFGHGFAAARLPLMVAASLLPLVAYVIGWRIEHSRRHALAAGLLTIFCGHYPAYWATTDAFGLFGLMASVTLLMIGLTSEIGDWRLELGAGLGAGLAHLTRADGLLLLVVCLGIAVTRPRRPGSFRPIALLVGGYLLVMLPWFARNTLITGSPWGGGGLSTIWLREFNEMFSYPNEVSLAHYLAAGWPAILKGKWDAVVSNTRQIITTETLFVLAPFLVVGLWRLRAHPLFRPVLLYALGLYTAMTLVFSFIGSRGGLFHSGVALMPAYMAASLVGLDVVIDRVAGRRKDWDSAAAKRKFTGMAVLLALGLTLLLAVAILSRWKGAGDPYRQALADLPADAVVMSSNPPGIWVATRHPGIPLVAGDVSNLLAAADQYSAEYVLLDRNHFQGLDPLYRTETGDRLRLVRKVGEWKVFEVMRGHGTSNVRSRGGVRE